MEERLRKKDLFEFFIEVYIIITSCFVEFKNGGGVEEEDEDEL